MKTKHTFHSTLIYLIVRWPRSIFFGKYLKTYTLEQTIFSKLWEYSQEKSVPFSNLFACATDGAPSMVGTYTDFTILLNEHVPCILTVHCVLQHHNLVANNIIPHLHKSLDLAIESINKIKANTLNYLLFRQLHSENYGTFERLLLHTEVRSLSREETAHLDFVNTLPQLLSFL